MATTFATGGLYPPIIDTYMPAYLQDASEYKVKFSISNFNVQGDFLLGKGGLQVAMTDLYTSQNILNTTEKWQNGYILKKLEFEEGSTTEAFFTFSGDDLKFGYFPINTYLKVQIRLAGQQVPPLLGSENKEEVAKWLSSNLNSFTEWSTVCLLSAITEPKVLLTIDGDAVTPEEGYYLNSWSDFSDASKNALTDLKLQVSFPLGTDSNGNDAYPSEILQNAQFYLSDGATSEHLYGSNEKIFPTFSSQPNEEGSYIISEINYSIPWNLQEEKSYVLGFHITTRNFFEQDYVYPFEVTKESLYGNTLSSFEIVEDIENGRNLIKVTLQGGEKEFYLKRTSSENNFTLLEDLQKITYEENQDFYIADNTIKSGAFYQYAIQAVDLNTKRRKDFSLTEIDSPALFDYAFLDSQGVTLVLKYDTQFSNYQRNVSESKIETIGGQYPFVRRNGHLNYKQISLSGLITAFMDIDEVFLNKEDFINQTFLSEEKFNHYREVYNINDYNDIILEREFRERVLDFLYANNVKLFRSAQEGNMLVKLMDIRLTPNQTLGRNIYSFSCMAYEVAPATVENYLKYNIVSSSPIKIKD